ncbi:hypothetical protein FPQ18DRAFT_303573 [Pyronema domesticum]|nr:hypothetical protein FPQ18DRAFT_303573 [Pyronema domesticum]
MWVWRLMSEQRSDQQQQDDDAWSGWGGETGVLGGTAYSGSGDTELADVGIGVDLDLEVCVWEVSEGRKALALALALAGGSNFRSSLGQTRKLWDKSGTKCGITIAGGIRRHFLLVSQAFPVDFSQAVVPTFVEQQSRNQSGFGSARGCSVHDWAADGVGYLLLASFLSGGFLGKKGEVGHGVVALLAARSDTTRGRGSLAEVLKTTTPIWDFNLE